MANNKALNPINLGVKWKLFFFTFRGCPWIRVSAYWQRNHGWKKVWGICLWQFLTLPSARGRSSVIGDAIGNKEIYFKEERTGSNNWDFASYSLPRLSVQNWEEDEETSSNRNGSRRNHQYESRTVNNSDLRAKSKVKLKSSCLNVKEKTKPVTRENGNFRRPGSWANGLANTDRKF